MSQTSTVKGIVLRDFTDAGTKERFTASDRSIDIAAGAFGNYEAAGLVRAPGTAGSADTADTKTEKAKA